MKGKIKESQVKVAKIGRKQGGYWNRKAGNKEEHRFAFRS